MKYCEQHNELEPCPVCRGARIAALAQEAQEFALAYEIVSPEHQQRFAKDAVALIRRLAAVLPQEAGAPPAEIPMTFPSVTAPRIAYLLTELERVRAERDAARALAEEFREAEASLSAAYVRVRAILKAWDTPPAPSGPQVWEVTERRAHEIVARVSRLQEALQSLVSCVKRDQAGEWDGHELVRFDLQTAMEAAEHVLTGLGERLQ